MRGIDILALVMAAGLFTLSYVGIGFSDRLDAMVAAQAETNKRLSVIDAKLRNQTAVDNELLILSTALQPHQELTPARKGKRK